MKVRQARFTGTVSTPLVIEGQTSVAGNRNLVATWAFDEALQQVSVDGTGTDTWSLAIRPCGSSEFKTLASGLAKSAVYLIANGYAYNALRVTMSGSDAFVVQVCGTPVPMRAYG